MSNFAAEFSTLGFLIHAHEPSSLFLVANNPEITLDELIATVDPETDYICHFNKCIFARELGHLARSLLFFTTNEFGIPHGFSSEGVYQEAPSDFPKGASGFILKYSECPPPPFSLASSSYALGGTSISMIEADVAANALTAFPPQHLPSAGFAATALLTIVNFIRLSNGKTPHRIVLVGFTGQYHTGAPFLHDFHLEQRAYRSNPFVRALGDDQFKNAIGAEDRALVDSLRTRFGSSYDFTSATKPQILTDLSEVFYRSGDMPSFQRLISAAISVNPSAAARQISLMIRSLTVEEDQRASDQLLNETEKRANDRARKLDAKWKLGKINWAPVGNPDLKTPHCEYKFKTDGLARVLVLNETSKIGFNEKHLGCYHVSRTIAGMLKANGLEYAGWANSIVGFNQILEADETRSFDAVLINGEGTFHSNAARAIELAMIGRYAKSIGKRVFLINSVWERNGRHLEELCSDFDLITVRESWSLREAKRIASEVILVPDLTWSSTGFNVGQKSAECCVVDCILPETSEILEKMALSNSLEFRTMSGLLRPFARAVQNSYPLKSVPAALSIEDLQHFGSWVSGRFHGLILALLHRSPVAVLQSNTSKIEAILDDIGISDKLCTTEDIQRSTERGVFTETLSRKLEYSEHDWDRIEAYRNLAVVETNKLFGRIRDLV